MKKLELFIDKIMREIINSQKITYEKITEILEKNLKSIILDDIKIKMGSNKTYTKKIKNESLVYLCTCKQNILPQNRYCPNCGRKIKRVE